MRSLLEFRRVVFSFLRLAGFFFFQAEDGIRDADVTGVQTCALPILRPLFAMSQAVAKRQPDALAPLAERNLPQELQPLAGSLNALLARLDSALGAQRRFTADAAHELRTPLAALKLQLDVARRANDQPSRVAAYDDLDAGVERAAHLVDQLLTLARIEPEALATRAVDCDLGAIAKEAIVARGA